MVAILDARQLWSTAPPEMRSRLANWPTVLFSWWCTSFAAVIIITRVLGRKVRSDRLFREDWIMLFSCVPMFIRMILVHFVLIYGTNNIALDRELTPARLEQHSIGARLVLASRIFYALTIWLNKLTVSEFLKRITERVWRRSWEVTLQGIRTFLLLTFIAVVIATLAECQPFDHYWQVSPDPGPRCRQGFAQLLTMGICDIITDILLTAFPIPVVLQSGQSWKRKFQMISLFSASIIMIAVTATRMPQVIRHLGRQQYRTVWASGEILAAVSVSNGVILGSFLRDKGTKKNKYRNQSIIDSIERASTRRPTLATLHNGESEEELFRSVGIRMPTYLQSDKSALSPRPAPPALPAGYSPRRVKHQRPATDSREEERSSDSDESLQKPVVSDGVSPPSPLTNRSVSLFDVGNLLEENMGQAHGDSYFPHMNDAGTSTVDFAFGRPRPYSRSRSRGFLRDVSSILRGRDGSASPRRHRDHHRLPTRPESPPIGVLGPRLERRKTEMSLQDAGGLLHPDSAAYLSQEHEMSGANGDPPPNSRRMAPSTANVPRTQGDIELDDFTDLIMAEERGRGPGGAMLLQATWGGGRMNRPASAPAPVQVDDSFDDMILNDAGGLMKG
ncbi:Hypothetical predicted protein [Lecanosticta acicola]|uniref:Rhodopsin domain-containing protein n=1 Tax=Lecanosticta acicola TaxID=111012 RepID=A0AAI8YRC7_9PEZI|nr:Hypothetical predicted protein [Lecanosticta acicola]